MAIAAMEDRALRHVFKLQQRLETKSHEHFMKIPSMGVFCNKPIIREWFISIHIYTT
jgi:hypothetical protein